MPAAKPPARPKDAHGAASRESMRSAVASLALRSAANNGDDQALDKALADGANPLERGKDGLTPLMLAASAAGRMMASSPARTRCVEKFIALGGLDARDREGLAALSWAARVANPEALAALIQAGAGMEPDHDGEGPVCWAVRGGDVECLRMLLAAGAPGDLPDLVGATPLMRAAEQDRAPMVNMLLTHGSDARKTGPMERDALMLAAADSGSATIDALLPHSNTRAQDEHGHTALMIAARAGNDAAIVVLSLDGDAWALSHQGLTALDLAAWARIACGPDALRALASSMAGGRGDVELAAALGRASGLAIAAQNGHEAVLAPLIGALIAPSAPCVAPAAHGSAPPLS